MLEIAKREAIRSGDMLQCTCVSLEFMYVLREMYSYVLASCILDSGSYDLCCSISQNQFGTQMKASEKIG